MIPMRLREMKSCPEHQQVVIVLEDDGGQRKLAIAVDPGEGSRLLRSMRHPSGAHPIYDFVDEALRACQVTPRVVLEYAPGDGLASSVSLSSPGGEVSVTCYPSDAIALAQRRISPST